MPILRDLAVPASAEGLPLPDNESKAKLFVAFIASDDPSTKQPWCPDVRAALPSLTEAFSPNSAPEVAFVRVGSKPEWKTATNIYRTKWRIDEIPTLVRYQRLDGEVSETGRLVDSEIQDEKKLKNLIGLQHAV